MCCVFVCNVCILVCMSCIWWVRLAGAGTKVDEWVWLRIGLAEGWLWGVSWPHQTFRWLVDCFDELALTPLSFRWVLDARLDHGAWAVDSVDVLLSFVGNNPSFAANVSICSCLWTLLCCVCVLLWWYVVNYLCLFVRVWIVCVCVCLWIFIIWVCQCMLFKKWLWLALFQPHLGFQRFWCPAGVIYACLLLNSECMCQ